MTRGSLSDEEIFQVACRIESAEGRRAYLDQACRDDELLRKQVDALLAAYDTSESFLESPAPEIADAIPTRDQRIHERQGTIIGPYKLLQQIGEGGMGVVFMAEQVRPVERKVALKIIKPGMDTRQVIARFEAERQALAMMDHPNIARVLDAGTTDAGRPYFVMALVQGVPITEYCDQCNLTTRERLDLFITVCHAVQHAHQKGIIHRDIKPTNVLVAMQDGRPAPKIIDFGVAKAIDQRLTEHTLTTAFAQMLGTPMYMSPEQAELSPLGVDTRSDIYSLGVLFYELLTGATPFDKERLHSAPYDEMRRIIREEEPPRPSARLHSLSDSLPLAARDGEGETAKLATTIAERRRTDPRRLVQTVRGELDWIVMKCLEKDRNRRYETPNSLARDIERYLSDEPVQACPPSAGYRFRKFARRNKSLLTAGGAIAAALVVGLGLATWQYFRATTESARATAVSDLLQETLSSANAERARGSQYTVLQLLDDFSAGLGHQLADEPAAEADIRATIGRAYRSLGMPEQAQPHLERAIELAQQVYGAQHEKVAAALVDYAQNLENQMRLEEAETQVRAALEIYRQRGVSGAPVIHALRILQDVLISSAAVTGRDDEAERVTEEALAVAHSTGKDYPELATMLHRYAAMRTGQARFAEAEQIARQAVDMHRRVHKSPHPELAYGLTTLAKSLHEQRKIEAAESAYRESLAVFRRCYPEEHPDVRSTIDALTTLLEGRGDKSELEREEAGFDSPSDHLRLASLLLTKYRSGSAHKEEARRLIRRAIDEYAKVAVDFPDNLRRRLSAVEGFVNLATLCTTDHDFAGELDQVDRRLTAELQALLATFANSTECQLEVAITYAGRAYFSATNQRQKEAADLLHKAVLATKGVRDPAYSVNALYYVAIVQLRLGDKAGYEESCAAMLEVPPGSGNDSTEFRRAWIWCLGPHAGKDLSAPVKQAEEWALSNSFGARYFDLLVLGGMHFRAGNYERAARCLEDSIATYPSDAPSAFGNVVFPKLFLAMTQWQQGQRDAARQLLAEIQPAIDEWLQRPLSYHSPSKFWNRPAILEVLRNEAEAMILPKKPDEVVEKTSLNPEP
jgi:serine/threonine protein kinase